MNLFLDYDRFTNQRLAICRFTTIHYNHYIDVFVHCMDWTKNNAKVSKSIRVVDENFFHFFFFIFFSLSYLQSKTVSTKRCTDRLQYGRINSKFIHCRWTIDCINIAAIQLCVRTVSASGFFKRWTQSKLVLVSSNIYTNLEKYIFVSFFMLSVR